MGYLLQILVQALSVKVRLSRRHQPRMTSSCGRTEVTMTPMIGMIQMKAIAPTDEDHPSRCAPDHFAPAVRWMIAGMDTMRTATSRITVAAAP